MAVEQTHFLVVGPGGSGVSTALDIFADYGFLTVAGLEPDDLDGTVTALAKTGSPVAFSLKLKPGVDVSVAIQAVENLKKILPTLKVLTLDAPEETLIQRYLKSEKKHAFETKGLQPAVAADKKQVAPLLAALKDYSIDTSTTTALELRHKIAKVLGKPIENQDFTVYITTFGFKYGAPQDAELMFDMRFMTNPFYDEALRPLTGKDKPVRDFIFNMAHARNFFEKWSALVAEMLPLYQSEGKTRLSIAIGCTGGKHRSVCMAEALAEHLKTHCPSFQVVMTHREMLRWGNSVGAQSNGRNSAEGTPAATCAVGEAPKTC